MSTQAVELARLALAALPPEARAELLREHAAPSTMEQPAPRLLTLTECSKQTGLSRPTLWRARKDGRLVTVEVRAGRHRVPLPELRRFAGGAA